MSKTTEIEGVYWWKDNNNVWYVSFDEEKIEEVKDSFTGMVGYRLKNSNKEDSKK
ncbi:hypothetical protein LCGC14_0556280 [marine sediment metagenome]|uniref:Uncharacterized protein n=1 Tax=marine sediment metagenome TaxID=412755 RepID=A0A0F9RN46_9ZZZZ